MLETLPADPLKAFEADRLSIMVVRDGQDLYRSYVGGVKPLLELAEWFPAGLDGATVIDRVVGGCAARVFAYLRAARVIGLTGSLLAEQVLHASGIPYEFHHLVSDIRTRDNTATCPFEQLSRNHPDPRSLISAIRERLGTRT